jgi:hypothetical protein
MKSPADWGNSATFFLHFPNEINNLDRHFESHQPPHPALPLPYARSVAARCAHQRSTRGPSIAPIHPVRAMPSVYQTATKAGDASGQAKE